MDTILQQIMRQSKSLVHASLHAFYRIFPNRFKSKLLRKIQSQIFIKKSQLAKRIGICGGTRIREKEF